MVFIAYLLWFYRFLYMKTTNLNFSANIIKEIYIQEHMKEPHYNGYGENAPHLVYLKNPSEVELFIEEMNSINVVKVSAGSGCIRKLRLSCINPTVTAYLYDNNNKIIGEVYFSDKYMYTVDPEWDIIINMYIVVDNYYEKYPKYRFDKYF